MDEGPGSSRIWQKLTRFFSTHSSDSVEQAIKEASLDGELDKEEGSMLLSVLRLDDLQVQDIMTPRTDIVSVEQDAPINEIITLVLESGHSRLPVYQDDRDNIVGVLHVKDLLFVLINPKEAPVTAKSLMRDPFYVPETKNVLGLLHEFRSRKQHLAVILDEYGGTAGIVSIEDVIEEIVGDIEDEHDAPREEEILEQPDGSFLLAGRTPLEDIAEKLALHIESDEVDTIGGYLSLLSGRVPKPGERFTLEDMECIVLEADARQIHRLQITPAANSPA